MNKIDGLDRLLRKFGNLNDVVSDSSFMRILDEANKGIVQADAKLNAPVNDGELRNSIKTSVDKISTGFRAATYTNKAHAGYNEFGTGPVGQENHEGISPEANVSYAQHGWGIPADKVDAKDAEQYGWPKRTYNGKDYYMTSGQPARPFMYPALKNNEKNVRDRVAQKVAEKIYKVVKK